MNHLRNLSDLCKEATMDKLPSVDDVTKWAASNRWTVLGMGATGGLALWYWSTSRDPRLPPGPRGWPVFGSINNLSRSSTHLDFVRIGKTYGDIFSVRIGPTTMIVLNNYKVIRDAYVEHGDLFADRPFVWLCQFMKDDIMMSPYSEHWVKKRKMIMAAIRSFGHGAIKSTEEKIQSQVEQFMEYIAPMTDAPIEMSQILPHFSANVVCNVLFNRVYDFDDPKLTDVINKIRTFYRLQGGNAFLILFFPKWVGRLFYGLTLGRKFAEAVENVRKILRPEIQEHIETLDEENPRDFFDMYLINARKMGKLDVEDMANSAFSVMPDGIDTASSGMEWTMLYLTLYPDVQRKVQEEIDRVTGGSRNPTHRDRPDFPYTEAVIMEVLRIVSPVLMSLSHKVRADTKFMGYHISEDYHVIANFWHVLHDPELYPEPHAFRPERFLDAKGNILRPEIWIPFGMGRRGCIAEPMAKMEIFLMVTNLLQVYNFTVPEGIEPPTTEALDEVIVRKAPSYKIMVTPRK